MPKPKPLTILFKEQNEYFHALGRFADRFARMEIELSIFLHMLSGLPEDKARIIFSGEKGDNVLQLISKLFEIRKADATSQKHIKIGLTQCKAILLLRNSVLHYGTQIHNIRPVSTSDRMRKPFNRTSTTYTVSARDFWRLCQDLTKAHDHLVYAFASPSMRKGLRQQPHNRLRKAWLYRFELKKREDKPQPSTLRRKRARRRRPSRK